MVRKDKPLFYDVKYILPGGKQGVYKAYTKKGAKDFSIAMERKFKAMTWIKER